MTRYRRVARRFQAKSDAGKQYTVIEYQEYDMIQTGGDTVSKIDGLKLWKTTTGMLLNEGDADKTFKIATTGEIIREI